MAISEPARGALAALSRAQPQADVQTQGRRARSSRFQQTLGMHAGFGMDGDGAGNDAGTAVAAEQSLAAAKIAADMEDLLAQLTAAQQAAEAVTASLQDTASHVRHSTAAPGSLSCYAHRYEQQPMRCIGS